MLYRNSAKGLLITMDLTATGYQLPNEHEKNSVLTYSDVMVQVHQWYETLFVCDRQPYRQDARNRCLDQRVSPIFGTPVNELHPAVFPLQRVPGTKRKLRLD